MYRVIYMQPDQSTGKYTLTDIPKDTKYIGIVRTLPDLFVSAQGDTAVLGTARAGGPSVIGMPTDLGGFELPTSLEFTWIGSASADTEGGAWRSDYSAVVILSSFPLRTDDAGVVLVGQQMSGLGRTVPGVLPGTMAQRYMEPSQGAVMVAAYPASADAAVFVTATPTPLALGAGVWTAVSGCYRVGADDARLTVCEVTKAEITVSALTGGPIDLMLTYWAGAEPAATTQPDRVRPWGDYDQLPEQVAGVQRPDVTALGADVVIRRVSITAAGQTVNLADLGGFGPMLRDQAGFLGMKLFARSVAGGSITGFSNWAWTDGPAKYVP